MDTENKYGTLQMQKALLELLMSFDHFSRREGIRYSLAYGSLLGAVRHKGFIPWDDDLDIVVDRANHDRIVDMITSDSSLALDRNTKDTLWVDRIRMKEINLESSYLPTIDIFIIDKVPDNKFAAKFKFLFIYMMQGMMKSHLSMKKGSLLMRFFSLITWLMGIPFSVQTKYRWYQNISKWGNGKPTKELACFNACFKDVHCRFDKDIMDKIEYAPFETEMAPVMGGYDNFLTSRYGDYMTPPKEKDRVPQHMKNVSV